MNFLLIGILVILCLLMAVSVILLKSQRGKLKSDLEALVHQVNELTLKHTMENRQALTQTLNDQVLQFQNHFFQQIGGFRKEIRDELVQSRSELSKNFQQIEGKVDSRLQMMTQTVQERLDKNISEGFKHFEKVQQHLRSAETQLLQLNAVGTSIVELNNLLKLPHLRGGFGETTLELLLENFFSKSTFELQYCVVPGSRERVDAVLKLPRALLPIDSKFPRERVLPLFENSTPERLTEARKVLGEAVKGLAKDIADKYIRPDFGTTDMAFMFLPSETLYYEVIRNGSCWEYCLKLKVFPVSPNTLSMTLHAIMKSLEFQELADGVQKTIKQIQNAQKHFEHFYKKFDDVGKELGRAQDAFHTAQSHLGRYTGSVTRLTGAQDSPTESLSEGSAPLPEPPTAT